MNDKTEGQGKAVILPNGQKRIEYIRDQYYNEGKTRSEIKAAVCAMYKEGEPGEIPYQIVFAATRDKEVDPRIASKAKAEERKAAKEKREALAAKEKEAKRVAKEKAAKKAAKVAAAAAKK